MNPLKSFWNEICISMLYCAVLSLIVQSCPTLCHPMDCSLLDSSVHGILQAGILEWVAMPSSKGSSQPRTEPMSPMLQVDSLSFEPLGKLENTGVGSPSLLQGIFLTQESNRGLLISMCIHICIQSDLFSATSL